MEELKVLMMGGRRVGKTSILASMYKTMMNSPEIRKHLTFSRDDTSEIKGTPKTGIETKDDLDTKYNTLGSYIYNKQGKTFIIDEGPTKYSWDYRFTIRLRNTTEDMQLHFLDVPGEWYNGTPNPNERPDAHRIYMEEQNYFKEFIKECNIYVIAIDTPFLMESEDPSQMREILASGQIQNMLANLYNDKDPLNKKMIVFVPVKCEKWIISNTINEVVTKIEEEYETIIDDADKERTQIAVIPLQTAGNIFFSSTSDPKTVVIPPDPDPNNPDDELTPVRTRVRKMGRGFLRGDGTTYDITGNENPFDIKLQDNIDNKLSNGFFRPYCWFTVKENVIDAAPRNCEQLPLHILSFWLKKYYEATTAAEANRGFFEKLKEKIKETIEQLRNRFLGIRDEMRGSFGRISPEQLKTIIDELEMNGVIKEGEDGIEYINKVL